MDNLILETGIQSSRQLMLKTTLVYYANFSFPYTTKFIYILKYFICINREYIKFDTLSINQNED